MQLFVAPSSEHHAGSSSTSNLTVGVVPSLELALDHSPAAPVDASDDPLRSDSHTPRVKDSMSSARYVTPTPAPAPVPANGGVSSPSSASHDLNQSPQRKSSTGASASSTNPAIVVAPLSDLAVGGRTRATAVISNDSAASTGPSPPAISVLHKLAALPLPLNRAVSANSGTTSANGQPVSQGSAAPDGMSPRSNLGINSMRESLSDKLLLVQDSSHIKVKFEDFGPNISLPQKTTFSVTVYYPKQFRALRQAYCVRASAIAFVFTHCSFS